MPTAFQNIPDQPLDSLCDCRLPRGRITLLLAPPAAGKTSLALHLASQLSNQSPLPGAPQLPITNDQLQPSPLPSELPPSPSPLPPQTTLILSPAESPHDLRSRLQSMHANLNNIYLSTQLEDLASPDSLDLLDQLIRQTPGIALLILDPLPAFLPIASKTKSAQALQTLLPRLAALAEFHHIAILLTASPARLPKVLHYQSPAAILRDLFPPDHPLLSLPTIYFLTPLPTPLPQPLITDAVPRTQPPPNTFFSPKDRKPQAPPLPAEPLIIPPLLPTTLLLTLKSSLSSPPQPLAFLQGPALTFLPSPALPASSKPLDPASQLAADWLQCLLTDGPLPSKLITRKAHEIHISQRALANAKSHLNLLSQKQSWTGTWFCSPSDPRPLPEDPEALKEHHHQIHLAEYHAATQAYNAAQAELRKAKKAQLLAQKSAPSSTTQNPKKSGGSVNLAENKPLSTPSNSPQDAQNPAAYSTSVQSAGATQ